MGIMVRDRAQQASLMEPRRADFGVELEPEPQLPSGWEKCLDMKSGLIYFKDWNTGTQTYKDPRQTALSAATQRIGLLSISLLGHEVGAASDKAKSTTNIIQSTSNAAAAAGGPGKKFKRKLSQEAQRLRCSDGGGDVGVGLPWALTLAGQTTTEEESSDRDNNSWSMDGDNVDQSLELSLNLPGTSTRPSITLQQAESVCTVEKVRSALERSQWLHNRPSSSRKRSSGKQFMPTTCTLSTSLSLLSSRPSSSRESNSPGPHSDLSSSKAASSPATSECSSECFTSPSAMSYQGDDEEVQQPRACREPGAKSQCRSDAADGGEVMVAVGCKSCLMYVMLSKQHPSCPKCGSIDVLLHLPAPPSLPPKRQRMEVDSSSPTWSWSTA